MIKKQTIHRLAGILLMIFVLAGILELGSMLYFRLSSGSFLSNRELLAREAGEFVRQTAKEDCSFRDFLFPHPYLGWVHHANEPCGWTKISQQGLYGREIPMQREAGVFRVLLTGGSVAVQLGSVVGDYSLESVLNQAFGTGKLRFEVINAAIEGWKQPQQLFATILYGGAVDGIVSLEGFNEFLATLKHSDLDQRMDMPWTPSYYATNPIFEQSRESPLASWVNQEMYVFARDHWLGSRSKFLLLLANVVRAKFTEWAVASRKDWSDMNTSLDSLFSLNPGKAEQNREWNHALYQHYLESMDAITRRSGANLAVFIQPTPARFRRVTEQEAALVGDLSYGPDYRAMEARLLALEGVSVFSLARIYEHVDETIYSDSIHQPVDGIGYRIMAGEIAEVIGEKWNLVNLQP